MDFLAKYFLLMWYFIKYICYLGLWKFLTFKIYYKLKKQKLQIYDFIVKKVYTDKLDGIVNKCNNGYHSTIKMFWVKRFLWLK